MVGLDGGSVVGADGCGVADTDGCGVVGTETEGEAGGVDATVSSAEGEGDVETPWAQPASSRATTAPSTQVRGWARDMAGAYRRSRVAVGSEVAVEGRLA